MKRRHLKRFRQLHREIHEHHQREHHGGPPWRHGGHWGPFDGDGPPNVRRWRYYFGAHLHRRLFMWFGAAILCTVVVGAAVFHGVGAKGGKSALLVFGVAGIVLWGMSGRIARRIARPLYELLRVTQEIGAGRLSARAHLPYWRIGEIALLAGSINDMAARIERQIADQRELLAGVSHEIRTPLARLRVLLELARQNAHADTGTIDEIEREVMEIDSLVGELLASARLDFAALTPRALDAGDVARRALERAALAADKVLAPLPTDGGGLLFQADPTLLSRALANLLDNARRHGGGVTAVRVRARPDGIAFEVEDGGPGFPAQASAGAPAERDARPTRPEGSLGLGLVLVRRIADAHKGTLTLANRPEGGARATLELPRQQPTPAAAPA